ncbi:Zinc finger protein [Lachnellula subtilissima]|uniref:Zinc finger protein n=1 Tax=Lachnellula subtilissima TaxID=602034 RepID=A0A8H8RFQ3_9HELO|nr:Zinc finger protein [Lachnellula subtilissima]
MTSPIQHQKSVEHCPCPYCVRLDSYILLLEAQLPPIDCPECKQSFSLKVSLEAHQLEELHASCYKCGVVFPTTELYASHMQSHAPASVQPLSPATQFRCCDCKRDFDNEDALTDHLRCSSFHRPGKEGKKEKKKKKKEQNQQEQGSPQTRCKKCKKTFKNSDSLNSHLSSVRHHPLSDIKCLADTKFATSREREMFVRDDEDEAEWSYCSEGYRTDRYIGRSHGADAARRQPVRVCNFDIADSESDTHPNIDRISRLLSALPALPGPHT